MILTILTIIFGMTIGELLTFLGLIIAGITSIVWINVKMTELRVRLDTLEFNYAKTVDTVLETAKVLKDTTTETAKLVSAAKEKIDMRLDDKMEKINEKIDHIVEGINEIKVNCVKQICNKK